MTSYQPQINTAFDLIRKKGRTVDICRHGEEVFNPVTQEFENEPVVSTVIAVVLPVSSTRRGMNETALKDLQESSVRKLLMPAKDFGLPPDDEDTYDLGGSDGPDWKTYGIDTLAPDGTDILYTVTIYK